MNDANVVITVADIEAAISSKYRQEWGEYRLDAEDLLREIIIAATARAEKQTEITTCGRCG